MALSVGEDRPRARYANVYVKFTPKGPKSKLPYPNDVLPTLTPGARARILAQAGAALRRIHQVRVEGFYRLHSNWKWDFPTWEALMHSHITDRTEEGPLLRECGFTEAEVDTMLAMMEEVRQQWPCPHPVLCHGEFHPGHLLVTDTHQLSGVIDFGEFAGGPSISDVAVFHG